MKKETVCFIDMDNVLSDNDYQLFQMIGKSTKEIKNKKVEELTNEERYILFEESQLVNFSEQYWRTMPLKKGAKELLNDCFKKYNKVKLISSFQPPVGIPHTLIYVRQSKIRWFQENFDNKIDINDIIVTKNEKHTHMETDKINYLISNDLKEVRKWRKNNGIGFIYNNYGQFKYLMKYEKEHE